MGQKIRCKPPLPSCGAASISKIIRRQIDPDLPPVFYFFLRSGRINGSEIKVSVRIPYFSGRR